ncbi:MAG: AI-2E family transporter, partial [Gammaproteobacteria bacterium]
LLGWLTFLLLVPVVTFYLLRDWDILVRNIDDLLPRRIEPRVRKIVQEIDAVLAEFLRGQLSVMLALAILYITGLWLVGLDLAFAIGLVAGLVSFVPYLGVIVGVLLAGIAALLQFGELWHLLGVVAVFGVGQLLEGMVLSPLLVGERIGLHPVAVIFAVMAGGQLFGFFGVLVALPVAAAIVVLLRHSRDEYKRSGLYDADLRPPSPE